jgi:hypothetical protein
LFVGTGGLKMTAVNVEFEFVINDELVSGLPEREASLSNRLPRSSPVNENAGVDYGALTKNGEMDE